MKWETAFVQDYLSDFRKLNVKTQKLVERAVKELELDPRFVRGNTIKKLKGYSDVWRYRVGDYRMIYQVVPKKQLVRLLMIAHRKKVYKVLKPYDRKAQGAVRPLGEKTAPLPNLTISNKSSYYRTRTQEEKLPEKLTATLLMEWGVEKSYHTALMACKTRQDLMNAVNQGVPSDVVGEVFKDLYPTTMEQIAAQPDYVLQKPEDLTAYDEGKLTAFLLRLDENQKPLTNWALSGPTLVKGGPGSGKSTVALYRLKALVEHHFWHTGRLPKILFTTYTNALINFSESLLRQLVRDILDLSWDDPLPEEIRVATAYEIQSEIAEFVGGKRTRAIKSVRLAALNYGRAQLQPSSSGRLKRERALASLSKLRDQYLLEEIDWVIEGQDCRSKQDYLNAERVGRGIPFNQSLRRVIWELFENYRKYLWDKNRFSYGQTVQIALDNVRSGYYKQRWDHVVVDEAQDLTPAAIALCVELCKKPKGLFLTADANQSLYNRGFRWTYVHENLNVKGRTRILTRNYRSTKEIAIGAAQILAAHGDKDIEALKQEYVHSGAYPVIFSYTNAREHVRWIAMQIGDALKELRLPPNSAAILVSLAYLGRKLASALNQEGIPAVFMRSRDFDLEDPRVKVTTLHGAKGLEIPIIFVAHVNDGSLPWSTEATDPKERKEFMNAQRKLFYVGCTRAMRYLFVTYDRDNPSPFLTDLTDDAWMHI